MRDSIKQTCFRALGLLLMMTLLLPFNAFGASSGFIVEGYYSEGIFKDSPETIALDGLTHLIYAFAIPKSDGTLYPIEKPEELKTIVARCHQKGIKVCLAVGGWSYKNVPLDSTFETLAASEQSRSAFAQNVSAVVEQYGLDGVELDWEYPDPGESAANYEKLVLGLRSQLNQNGKFLTAAVNGAWSPWGAPAASGAVSAKCLNAFDWISVMGYDMNDSEHSPYTFAETSVAYWLNRGVPTERIVLGIPLYARPSWKQYRDIVKENPTWSQVDYAPTKPLASWYNGLPTIEEKTLLALRKAGGVMLFDIHEDATGDSSAVSAVQNQVKRWEATSRSVSMNTIHSRFNGAWVSFNPDTGIPFVDGSGRIQMPLRLLGEKAGATVTYTAATQKILLKKGGKSLELRIGSNILRVNGTPVKMDTQAIVKNGRTYIPARPILENLGYGVAWHDGSHTVVIQ